jgi:hypothetical protein
MKVNKRTMNKKRKLSLMSLFPMVFFPFLPFLVLLEDKSFKNCPVPHSYLSFLSLYKPRGHIHFLSCWCNDLMKGRKNKLNDIEFQVPNNIRKADVSETSWDGVGEIEVVLPWKNSSKFVSSRQIFVHSKLGYIFPGIGNKL